MAEQIDPTDIIAIKDPLLREMSFLMWLKQNHYIDPKPITDGRWAAISEKMFTVAINTGPMMDFCSVSEHWCYSADPEGRKQMDLRTLKLESYKLAKAAFDAWDGNGEPTGWIRHPLSGRRLRNDEIIFAP